MRASTKTSSAKLTGIICPLLAISLLLGFEHDFISNMYLALAAFFFLLFFKDKSAFLPMAVALLFFVFVEFDLLAGALYYPVLMSAFFFIVFVHSLFQEECLIQKFARKLEPDIPDHAIEYCRWVHAVWTIFLAVNTLVALYSTSDLQLWSWYNGVISYLLMGTLFVLEYAVRTVYRRRMEQS